MKQGCESDRRLCLGYALVMNKKKNIVPWDFPVPKGLRESIVSAYVPLCEEGTDKRYKKELSGLRSRAIPRQQTLSDATALAETLNANGIKTQSAKTSSEFMNAGGGNFWVIPLERACEYSYGTTLFISELGQFMAHDVFWYQSSETEWKHIDGLEDSQRVRENISQCQAIAKEAGYVWLEYDLLFQTVPSLNVNGIKNPDVFDLAFYFDS